jgi:nitroreductase
MDKPAATDLPIHDLVRARWSPRSFTDEPVTEAQVRTLLEAARWAPSAFNEQPWSFLVATKDDRPEYDRLLGTLNGWNQAWAGDAPLLIVALTSTAYRRNGKPNGYARHDLGLALGQLMLQATALGLSSHPMAGFDADAVRSTYGLPDDVEAVTAIAIGRQGPAEALGDDLAEVERKPRERRAQSEFVFTGRFGQPRA